MSSKNLEFKIIFQNFKRYVLSFSLIAGRLYTASHVFTEPGMQNPNSKSKLLISCKKEVNE